MLTIKGKIIDDHSEPLPGVTILISKGKGITSDFDGNYEFTIDDPKQTIEFSYVGNKKEYKAKDIPEIIQFKENALDEIVIIGHSGKKDYTIPIIFGVLGAIAVVTTVVIFSGTKPKHKNYNQGLQGVSRNKLTIKKVKL